MGIEAKVSINRGEWMNVNILTGQREEWDMGDGYTASLEDHMDVNSWPYKPFINHVITNPGGGRSIGFMHQGDGKDSFKSTFSYDSGGPTKYFEGKDIRLSK